MINQYFDNNLKMNEDGVHILDEDDNYSANFGKQWRDYRDVQIDSKNNFDISYKYLKDIFFEDLTIIKDKEILEIGCGAGRFTEHLIKYCKLCFSIDMSQAIFFNVSKGSNKLHLIKSNFISLKPKKNLI